MFPVTKNLELNKSYRSVVKTTAKAAYHLSNLRRVTTYWLTYKFSQLTKREDVKHNDLLVDLPTDVGVIISKGAPSTTEPWTFRSILNESSYRITHWKQFHYQNIQITAYVTETNNINTLKTIILEQKKPMKLKELQKPIKDINMWQTGIWMPNMMLQLL